MGERIPGRGIRITKAWEHQGVCLPPETDSSHMSPVQGPRREEEAENASWGQVVDALIYLAMNFILSTN